MVIFLGRIVCSFSPFLFLLLFLLGVDKAGRKLSLSSAKWSLDVRMGKADLEFVWLVAGLDVGWLNRMAAVAVGLRALYNVLYIRTTTDSSSYSRTAVWFSQTGVALWVLGAAGVKMM